MNDFLLCLSIRQPFCEQIMLGRKYEEYRTWPTRHRGTLLIHASKSTAEEGSKDLPRGVIVGSVEVVSCLWDARSDCYAWRLRSPRRFAEPIPFVGKVGLFRVPMELIQAQLVG